MKNDPSLPPEATLSLYSDTECRATGQYFCNIAPFSMPRTGNKVTLLASGKDVLQGVCDAMMAAKSFIWIADWQMAFDVELTNRDVKDYPGRLRNIIAHIISTKKVQIRILLFRSIADPAVGTYDGLVQEHLNALNKSSYPGSVSVVLQGPTSAQNDSQDYSHHQKFVVVDGTVAFIGGIDLSYGRWETTEFDVVVDPERYKINEMYNPCQPKPRGVSPTEQKLIDEYRFCPPYGKHVIDEGCQPRMPWQDVHIKLEGPSVVDIHRNFVRRWNSNRESLLKSTSADRRMDGAIGLSGHRIDQAWLEKIGAWTVLKNAQELKSGGAQVQIVRSVSSKHLWMEGHSPDDLKLYASSHEQATWKFCLSAWSGAHQSNIHNAMVNCIRSADNYIYIETQFFISSFGKVGDIDSSKIGNEDDGMKNAIVDELAKRIHQHIVAQTPAPFHVYLVFPVHPEGMITNKSVSNQHWLALASIKWGSESLINRIKKSLASKQRPAEEWIQYLTVLNMRSYGATALYARDPETFEEDFKCEIGRYVVTEQIYIHSKLMIVDDAVAIVGSANSNDRSLTGNGDTEIAAIVVDTEGVELRDLGSPNFKVVTRKFARELRQQLWKKHFGFLIGGTPKTSPYFDSTVRATRGKATILAALHYPPRLATTASRFLDAGKFSMDEVMNQPCNPRTVHAIQTIARRNASVYEEIFQHTPRDSIKKFESIGEFSELPYIAAFAEASTEFIGKDPRAESSPDERLASNPRSRTQFDWNRYQAETVRQRGKEGTKSGIIPPALKAPFMTTILLPHQQSALAHPQYGKRQQLYADGKIHDVEKAIMCLKEKIVGFFVAAPLDWGIETKIDANPSKVTGARVDVALHDDASTQDSEKTS